MAKRGRYYDPPRSIGSDPEVTKRSTERHDEYIGNEDALIRIGLIRRELLPGQPGNPIARATWRPRGFGEKTQGWYWTEGFMEIFRNPSGRLRVCIVVSAEERERRAAAAEMQRHAECAQRDLGEGARLANSLVAAEAAFERWRARQPAHVAKAGHDFLRGTRASAEKFEKELDELFAPDQAPLRTEHRRTLPPGWSVVRGDRV